MPQSKSFFVSVRIGMRDKTAARHQLDLPHTLVSHLFLEQIQKSQLKMAQQAKQRYKTLIPT